MNKKIIRLTESDLRNIVKESVSKVINEIGDTPKGQRALGALGQRHALRNPKYDARDTKSKEAKIYDYAEKARGGDTYDYKGTPQNPKYYDYANGAIDYLNSHTDELAAAHRRAGIGENRITEDTDHQSRFDSIINTCEEETEKLINAIYESNGIFSSGNDEAMVMRLRRLIKILNKAANSKFETVKNTGLAYNLFNMLSMYYSTVREATYNLESLDFQGLNQYVSQLEHYIIGILD